MVYRESLLVAQLSLTGGRDAAKFCSPAMEKEPHPGCRARESLLGWMNIAAHRGWCIRRGKASPGRFQSLYLYPNTER